MTIARRDSRRLFRATVLFRDTQNDVAVALATAGREAEEGHGPMSKPKLEWTKKGDAEVVAAFVSNNPLPKGELPALIQTLRGNMNKGLPLIVADGYHRICAVCYFDESAPIPCRTASIGR
jgi:hypothetical protein